MRDLESIVAECRDLLRDPYGQLAATAQRTGARYWGHTCLFAPEELLAAAGYIPLRLFGAAPALRLAERHMPSNCCEFARNLLESFLDGRFAFLSGALIPHSCDPLQVATDVARRETKTDFYFFNMPTTVRGSSFDFLVDELTRLKLYLEEKRGRRIEEREIRAAVQATSTNQLLLRRLYAFRRSRPGVISGADAAALTMAGLYLARSEHNRMLREALADLELRDRPASRKRKRRVVISGFANGSVRFIELVESCGCLVVDDDLCEGSRILPREVDPAALSSDWADAVAEQPRMRRAALDLVQRARRSGVRLAVERLIAKAVSGVRDQRRQKEIRELAAKLREHALWRLRVSLGSDEAPEGLNAIARRLLATYCPVKNETPEDYFQVLSERYKASQADGLIVAHYPFCDPHAIEYAAIKHRFAEANMEVLHLEVVGDRHFGQIQTRIEAFLERLRVTRSPRGAA